jgi:hypothetical protein
MLLKYNEHCSHFYLKTLGGVGLQSWMQLSLRLQQLNILKKIL